MTSIKIKLRPSIAAKTSGTIYYQIIHNRSIRQIGTDHHVEINEWNHRTSGFIFPEDTKRRLALVKIREEIHSDMQRFDRILRRLDERSINYDIDDIVAEFHRYAEEYTFFRYMNRVIAKLKTAARIRTSETYRTALNMFRRYREEKDIRLELITQREMQNFEAWLCGRKLCPNSISFYMRILRAVYNRAVEEDIIDNRFPFRHVYTGVDKTIKRALPMQALRKIKAADLADTPKLDFARNMFLLSFYLRGMSMVDMAFLKKCNLKNRQLVYRRQKTGQLLKIEWTPEMQQILDRYPGNPTDYLLPIITKEHINERYAYRNTSYNINRSLKTIAERLGLPCNLTMYVARHSWASIAKAKGIPISVISQGMGHDSEKTTLIYLASLDSSVVDNANSLIIKSL